MESTPEFSKSKSKPTTNSTSSPPVSSDHLQVEESPIFSYISSLSPIKPDKATPVTQGFRGINSPPLLFRSPEIIQKNEPSFLRRPQFSRSSDAGFSGQHENFEATVTGMEESRRSNGHLSSGLSRTCLEKANDISNSSLEKASSSPWGCVDDYLTETVIMGDGDSASSANLTPKNSGDIFHSQTDLLDLKSVANREENDDCRNDEMVASPVILKQDDEDDQKKSSTNLKPVVPIEKSGDGNISPDMCPKVEPDTSEDHALDNRQEAQNAECGHMFEKVSTSLLESLHIAVECGSCCENAGGPCIEAVENKMHGHSPKVVQHQHGMSRRCLQFEDAQGQMKINIGFQNSSGSAGHSKSSARPGDSKVLESASLNKQTSPSSKLFDNMILPMSSPETSGISNVNVPKRSGIGLHLNSIVNPILMGSGAKVSMKSTEGVISDGAGKKSISIIGCDLHKNCSISSKVAESVSVSRSSSRHDTCTAAGSATLSPYSMKPLYEAVLLKPIECQSNPSNKRMFKSETFDCYEDFGQSSLKKKRKKTLEIGDNNGCKRCNCKKTKCLKLYCDCFAAGIYCSEPCACQGCFNRPEYEDSVLETRRQIESRNPLAFAPKIIQQSTEAPSNIYAEDGGHFTPSSARHKIGCNCKKSKCLKKYCECYQANVGCSNGCRCEACENVYGRKGEYDRTKGLFSKEDNSSMHDSSFDTMHEPGASNDGFLHNELCNSHNLTPLTPSFQCSNHGKGESKAQFSSERYLPSPDSAIKAPCGVTPEQATNPDNHNFALVTNPEIMDLLSVDLDLGYGNGHTVSQFAPRCDADVPSNAGHLSAQPNSQYWTNTLRAQMFPGNHQISSASSLRWRSSPITPTNFEGTKLHQVVDFDALCSTNDSTPEILKTPVPPDAVKVSSPNKKRVSPRAGGIELGSSSSADLRTGRKFILQAIPSFPSLIPCNNTTCGSGQNMNSSQKSSCSK